MIFHWLLCLMISGGFLAFQLRQFAALNRFALRAMDHLTRRGGEPIAAEEDAANGWRAWLDEAANRSEVALSRDDAIAELDDWLRRQPSLGWLQRAGVIAPMVGVVITVLGFWFARPVVEPGDGQSAMPVILGAVGPLFSGVFAGALLAIFNQVLLQLASNHLDTVREAGRRRLEMVLSTLKRASPADEAAALTTALQTLTHALRRATADQEAAAARLIAMYAGLSSAAEAALATAAAFERRAGEVSTLGDAVVKLNATVDRASRNAGTLAKAVERFGAVGEGLSAIVEKELSHAVAAHTDAVSATRASTQTLGEAATDLKSASSSLREAGADIKAIAAAQGHLTEGLGAAYEQLAVAATETGTAAKAYAAKVPAAVDQWSEAAARFDAGVREHFVQAAKSHGEAAGLTANAAQDIAKALGSLGETVVSLEGTSAELGTAAVDYATAGRVFNDSLRTEVMPAHQTLGRAVGQLQSSAERLASFIEKGVGPATEKLASLGALVEQVRGSTAALQELTGLHAPIAALGEQLVAMRKTAVEFEALAELRGDVEALLEALGRACEVTNAIDEIPKRFGEVLNGLTDEALRRQSSTLQETLGHLLKQAGDMAARGGYVVA